MNVTDAWSYIREKFPPARAVLALVGLGAPIVSAFNTWLINHLPFIAEQVNGDDLALIWAGGVAALVALAYKFLDGQAKWEGTQVSGYVALAQADKITAEQAKEVLEPPPRQGRGQSRRMSRDDLLKAATEYGLNTRVRAENLTDDELYHYIKWPWRSSVEQAEAAASVR